MQLTRNNPNQIILDIRESQAAFGIFPLYLEMPLIFTDFQRYTCTLQEHQKILTGFHNSGQLGNNIFKSLKENRNCISKIILHKNFYYGNPNVGTFPH